MMPYILMQSTSVDVVSVNPAAGAEVPGHALIAVVLLGTVCGSVRAVDPTLGTLDPAADATFGTIATVAQRTATLASSAVRLFILVSILPPYCL